jgi:hypothetical protein
MDLEDPSSSAICVRSWQGALGIIGVTRGCRGDLLLVAPAPPIEKRSVNLLFQSGKIFFDGAPDNSPIDIEIVVDHFVALRASQSMAIRDGLKQSQTLSFECSLRPHQ